MTIQHSDSRPIIKAIRKINRYNGHYFLIFRCPVCGGTHSHGILAESKFGANDGPRSSECRLQPPKRGRRPPGTYLQDYILIETRSKEEAGFY